LNGELANNLLVIDESGYAICNDTIDIELFSDIDLFRIPLAFSDTTKIASEDLEVEILNVDSIYNIPTLSLRDTVYCPQDPINYTFDGNYEGGFAWIWSTEEITPTITVMEEGEFSVTVTADNQYGCYIQCDTSTVATYDTLMLVVSIDTAPWCETRLVNYSANVIPGNFLGPVEYLWSTGDTDPEIALPVPSEASVTVTDGCNIEVFGMASISENPDIPDEFDIVFDVDRYCDTGEFFLAINSATMSPTDIAGLTDIVWLDGTGAEIASSTSAIMVPGFGSYSFTAVDNCNFDVGETITISEDSLPAIGSIAITADDEQICDLGVILNASSIGGSGNLDPNTFVWSTGVMGSQIVINDFEPTYMVSGEDCRREVTAELNYTPSLDEQVSWPNIFFPDNNSDGIDSIDNFFGPLIECPELVEDYELRVYNRWGQLMFETSDPSVDWDGRKDGDEMPGDAYVFYARYVINEIEDEVNGTVTLAR